MTFSKQQTKSSYPAFPESPLYDHNYESMRQNKELEKHLGWHCLKGLKKALFKETLVDLTSGRRVLKGWMVLSLAWILSRQWREQLPEKRVGVVLPSGTGGVLVNLSLLWAGKIPVNLNFTTSREFVQYALQQTEIKTIISAEAMKEKLPQFPWGENTVDIVSLLKEIPKWKIIFYGLKGMWTPLKSLWKAFQLPLEVGDEEAAILFSSGSCAEPKGIVLSHRNIVGNCLQIQELKLLDEEQKLLGCLPLFHSFGFAVTLWFPLISSTQIVYLPSPLEFSRIVRAIESEKITVLIGTPTFLRPYLKKATGAQLASLRFVIAGAEKVPLDLFEKFRRILGVEIMEGYGLTETSPVVGVNLPEEEPFLSRFGAGKCRKEGSIGRLFPGMQAAVLDSETHRPLDRNETGMLYLRGPNIFKEYLKDPEQTHEVLQRGWLRTGDLGKIDEDGFLYIEGRLSRFSKIGGEMVPHGKVEELLTELLELGDREERALVVMGIQHPTKGETLIILSTVELGMDKIREQLQAKGVPNLWIPREWYRVDAIPVLLAGKLDLKNCQKLAESLSS